MAVAAMISPEFSYVSWEFTVMTNALKDATGTNVSVYHLKPGVRIGRVSCWCDHGVGVNKCEHRVKPVIILVHSVDQNDDRRLVYSCHLRPTV